MYNLQKAFENSLRGFYQTPPNSPKPKHTGCRGTAHGTGNYAKTPDSPLPCAKTAGQRPQNGGTPLPPKKHCSKSNSVSSECCSDTDTESVAGLKISERLHQTSTQASNAKTAKMRYLESLDSEDILLIAADLNSRAKRNGEKQAKSARAVKVKAALDRDEEKSRKHRRKEILRKVLAQDVNSRDLKNGVVVLNDLVANGGAVVVRNGSSLGNGLLNGHGAPVGGGIGNVRTGFSRRKLQRTLRRLSNIRTVTLDELVAQSDGLRPNCVPGLHGNAYLKSWEELMQGKCHDAGGGAGGCCAKDEEEVFF